MNAINISYNNTYIVCGFISSTVIFDFHNECIIRTVNNKSIPISICISNDEYYIIKDGLKVGDSLIVDGNYNLAHQSKVRITSVKKY